MARVLERWLRAGRTLRGWMFVWMTADPLCLRARFELCVRLLLWCPPLRASQSAGGKDEGATMVSARARRRLQDTLGDTPCAMRYHTRVGCFLSGVHDTSLGWAAFDEAPMSEQRAALPTQRRDHGAQVGTSADLAGCSFPPSPHAHPWHACFSMPSFAPLTHLAHTIAHGCLQRRVTPGGLEGRYEGREEGWHS